MPEMLTGLYEHQRAAIDKIGRFRIGGLFMEMGTGKTRVTIEMAVRRREAGKITRCLWFCPVSTKETIKREIYKHVGEEAYVFNSQTTDTTPINQFWVIIGIESMSSSDRVRMAALALAKRDTMAVVDESSFIKHHSSERSEWITRVGEACHYRLILTGTPISQGIVDLYSQMRFLSPRILGYPTFKHFACRHIIYDEERIGCVKRYIDTDKITARITPLVYSVRKDDCIDLPKKIYKRAYFQMSYEQAEYYDKTKRDILSGLTLIEDEAGSWDERLEKKFIIYELFNALQQIICGFHNETQPDGTREFRRLPNPRLSTLLDLVLGIPKDRKIIIWAKYIHDIDEIVKSLGSENCSELSGRLSEAERTAGIDQWRTSKRFLVATQDTGGFGITLNEASYVIFYSNQFKYSSRIQAEDRSHRIGQDKTVVYIDLVCEKSIDEVIQEAISRKADAAALFRSRIRDLRDIKKVRQAFEKL
jgi:SNF2 family DNA or RNA helicase